MKKAQKKEHFLGDDFYDDLYIMYLMFLWIMFMGCLLTTTDTPQIFPEGVSSSTTFSQYQKIKKRQKTNTSPSTPGRPMVDDVLIQEEEDLQNYLKQEFPNYSLEDYEVLEKLEIDSRIINCYRQHGYDSLTLRNFLDFEYCGIDTFYVKGLSRLGLETVSTEELINLCIYGVTLYHIGGFHKVGFDNLTPEELTDSRVYCVDVDFVKEIHGIGYTDVTFQELIEFSMHGIDKYYIYKLNKELAKKLTPSDLILYKVNQVEPNFLKGLKRLKIEYKNKEELLEAVSLEVDLKYIQDSREYGLKSPRLSDYIELKKNGPVTFSQI